MGPSIGDSLLEKGRPNSLNLVRLGLALAVVVSHSFPLGGFGSDPSLGGLNLGTGAVCGFFAISGFLISASRERLAPAAFFRARALRILPGFWVCLLLTAFVTAPLAGWMAGSSWSPASSVSYVVKNVAVWRGQAVITGTLEHVPYGYAWDDSLWTLPFEAMAYLVVMVLLVSAVRKHLRLVSTALFLFALVVVLVVSLRVEAGWIAPYIIARGSILAPYFVAGMVLYAWRDRVRVSPVLAVGAAVLLGVGLATGTTIVLAPLAFAYLMLYLGAVIPPRWAQRNDISYGVYIYAFLVQQLLATAGFQHFGVLAFIIVSVIGAVALGWLSWLLVERPAMRFKPRRSWRPSGASTPTEPQRV